MKQRIIFVLYLLALLVPSASIGQVAGSPGLGGRTGAGGFSGAAGLGVGGRGVAGMGAIAGVSGSTYAGAAGLGGALVARRRYIGVRVEGTDWLAASLPILGLLSLGAILVTMIRKEPVSIRNLSCHTHQ